MVKCQHCGKEMTKAKGCGCVEIEVDGEWYPRIRVGRPGDLAYGYREFHRGDRCGDCGAQFGQFHHPGCDMEACPKCGNQLLSCDCNPTRVRTGYIG